MKGRIIRLISNQYQVLLENGQIVERGSIEDIYTKPVTDVTKRLLKDAGIGEVSV